MTQKNPTPPSPPVAPNQQPSPLTTKGYATTIGEKSHRNTTSLTSLAFDSANIIKPIIKK